MFIWRSPGSMNCSSLGWARACWSVKVSCIHSQSSHLNHANSAGEKWRTHRKMIAPTFHSSILKSFMPIFNKNSRVLLQQLNKVKGQEFDVHDYMSGTTVDILLGNDQKRGLPTGNHLTDLLQKRQWAWKKLRKITRGLNTPKLWWSK